MEGREEMSDNACGNGAKYKNHQLCTLSRDRNLLEADAFGDLAPRRYRFWPRNVLMEREESTV
jgi:hypothetical protein